MSATVTCDNCGKHAPRSSALLGWWTVSPPETEVVAWGGGLNLAGDYCSTLCVREKTQELESHLDKGTRP